MATQRSTLNKLLEDIGELEEGCKLLEDIWLFIGAYSDKLNDELMHRLNTYFGFDDSE